MALRKRYWVLIVFLLLVAVAGTAFYLRPVEIFQAQQDFQMHAKGWQDGRVMVSGYKVHYFVTGPENGQPVVLVHGLGGRAEEWYNLAPYLVYAGFRVYAPDLPGYGQSEQPADFSYSVGDQANIVVGFMDAVGVHQADVGGVSMGGWIVQLVAARHPDRVRRLIILDSVGLHVVPTWDTRLFTPANSSDLGQLEALLMPHPPKAPEFIVKDILRVSDKNAWVIRRALTTMLSGTDTTDAMLPQLKMPVLLVWGELDRITPVSLGEQMHQLIPQSRLEVLKGCGHLAHAQCVAQYGPMVQSFLR